MIWQGNLFVCPFFSGFCEATFEGHELDVLCIAISIDGTFAVSGSSDHTLRVWDLKKRMAHLFVSPITLFAQGNTATPSLATQPKFAVLQFRPMV